MVRIDCLNAECAQRLVSRAIPAQVLCRLLGNETRPCPVDPLCRASDRHGIALLYGAIGGAVFLCFLCLFWALRLTRLSRLLGWMWGWLFPPLRLAAQTANQARHFWNDLTESL